MDSKDEKKDIFPWTHVPTNLIAKVASYLYVNELRSLLSTDLHFHNMDTLPQFWRAVIYSFAGDLGKNMSSKIKGPLHFKNYYVGLHNYLQIGENFKPPNPGVENYTVTLVIPDWKTVTFVALEYTSSQDNHMIETDEKQSSFAFTSQNRVFLINYKVTAIQRKVPITKSNRLLKHHLAITNPTGGITKLNFEKGLPPRTFKMQRESDPNLNRLVELEYNVYENYKRHFVTPKIMDYNQMSLSLVIGSINPLQVGTEVTLKVIYNDNRSGLKSLNASSGLQSSDVYPLITNPEKYLDSIPTLKRMYANTLEDSL